jgi:hypothetical protein
MKTKNFLLTGALLIMALFSVNGVMAEGPANTNVTVNIKFTPIQTIEVNGSQNEVNFVYENIATYQSGASDQFKEKHLKINSSGPFVVNVMSTNFDGDLSDITIPASDVAVQVVNTTGYTGAGIEAPLRLSATKKTLFTSTVGGMNLEFNVTYSNPGGKNGKYLEGYLKGEEVIYTADVTYEIIAI